MVRNQLVSNQASSQEQEVFLHKVGDNQDALQLMAHDAGAKEVATEQTLVVTGLDTELDNALYIKFLRILGNQGDDAKAGAAVVAAPKIEAVAAAGWKIEG